MILLKEIDNFLSWYCTQDPFIQHQVNDRNAYARTISEAEQGNRVKLDYPRMEWVQLPNSQLSDNNAEYEWEEMAVTLRVITKSIRNDWDAEREAMDDCKAALARMLKYITDVVKSGECCETDLLCLFDLSGSTIGYLDKATSGGDFVGAQLRLQFKKDFDVEAVVSGTYPPLYSLSENSVKVWDVVQQKFVWVAVSSFGAIQQETDPVFAAWLATNPIPVIPTNISAFVNDAGYLTELPEHNHDDRYYTESEVDALLSGKENTIGFTPENAANKAQPNGYASLDSGGKIPASQLPNSVMELQGNWNAATNTPTLADGIGNAGDVWEVTTAGTTNFGSGNISFNVGDWAVYGADGKWYNSRNSNEVTSVNGFTGTINLVPTDAEMQAGTNDTKAASPKKVTDWWTWVKTQAQTFAAKITFTIAPRFNSVTAGHFLKVDSNKDLTSAEKIQPSEVNTDEHNRFVTDAEKATWNANSIGLWTAYNPLPSGFASLLDSRASYIVIGKLCFVKVIVFGISNSGNTTFQLPFSPANSYFFGTQVFNNIPCYGINNNAPLTTSASVRLTNSITASVFSNMASNSWFNVNQKGFMAQFFYEID